jgi:hydrogenase expression/formation protein HypD
MPAAMAALVADEELSVDGFLCPGHVSVVAGARIYEFLARDHGVPCVVGGFESLDLLQSFLLLVRQLVAGEAKVEIQYRRAVTWEGNRKAQAILRRVFVPVDAEWRGLGVVPGSGLGLAPEYQRFDAEKRFPVAVDSAPEPPGCLCGAVLRGARRPPDCTQFGGRCTPETPLGPCMVSSEGTCAAYYRYAR